MKKWWLARAVWYTGALLILFTPRMEGFWVHLALVAGLIVFQEGVIMRNKTREDAL